MTSAERQRRYRQRLGRGRRVLHVEVDEVRLAETLIEAGYLHRGDEDDQHRLVAALENALDRMEVVEE